MNLSEETDGKQANILIIDDMRFDLAVLSDIVRKAGYLARPVISVKQAMEAIEVLLPHLILLDVTMPEMDGYEYCAILKKNPATKEIPVIFISGLSSTEDRITGYRLGAVDYIVKPFEQEEVTMRIGTHLKNYRLQQELFLYNNRLQQVLKEQLKKITNQNKAIVTALAKLAEAREYGADRHLPNVSANCRLIAMSLQLSPRYEQIISNEFVDTIEMASMLHDIGKISVSERILCKPDKLTEPEREVMKQHPKVGGDTLTEIVNIDPENKMLSMAALIAYYHHEHYDGSGYPFHIKGEDIPLPARIMAIADVYDSLVSERCYKKPYSEEDSMNIILSESGRMFDPGIVSIVSRIRKQLKR